MKYCKLLSLISYLIICSSAYSSREIVRLTPDTMPSYITLEINASGCDTKKIVENYVAYWYATLKVDLTTMSESQGGIMVFLRDAKTDEFLFNPGVKSHLEGGYIVHSVTFNSKLIGQIVFQWVDDKNYEIYIRDFYKGEKC